MFGSRRRIETLERRAALATRMLNQAGLALVKAGTVPEDECPVVRQAFMTSAAELVALSIAALSDEDADREEAYVAAQIIGNLRMKCVEHVITDHAEVGSIAEHLDDEHIRSAMGMDEEEQS